MHIAGNVLLCAGHLPANGLRMRTAGITDLECSFSDPVMGVEGELLGS
jgi:hypothetical protein